MFLINEDNSIYVTRGDIAVFQITAMKGNVEQYKFQAGDVIRMKVFEKKACENVVMQKDFAIEEETEVIGIYLEEQDTKIGEVISKPKDYWYEIELNPDTDPQTIIGYDEDGAKVFRLFPEGADVEELPVEEDSDFERVIKGTVEKWLKENNAVTDGQVEQVIKKYFEENEIESGSIARIGEAVLLVGNWNGSNNLYSQVVNIDGVTKNSQVDLTPSVEQLAAFYEKDLTFVTENENGVVTVYAIGQKPTNDYTIQVTITEVEYE
jgi:hypothetical protein